MRAANRPEEVEALEERRRRAEVNAESRGSSAALGRFREAVRHSRAVISKSLALVNQLVSSDNQLSNTFYQSVASEARLPEQNEWDTIRQSVDALMFPYYAEHISFAALSLDGQGVPKFGAFSLALKEATIRERASVFEENSIEFVKQHRIVPGDALPMGFRASWDMRDSLAVAKLEPEIGSSTEPNEFASILLRSQDGKDDFIEVHVYGPIHRRGIERLTGAIPRRRADKAILESVTRKLREVGAEVEVRR